MFFLYEIAAFITFVAIIPFYALGRLLGGRKLGNIPHRLGFYAAVRQSHDVWIHAVSVGEVAAAKIVADAIRRVRPGTSLVVTTTTATGQDLAKRLFSEATITWFPFDFTFSVKRFLSNYSPSVHVAMETELWPILTRACSERGIRLSVANGRLSDRSFPRYFRFRRLAARVLRSFDLLMVRERIDRERFVAIGALPERVVVTGNVKFDLQLPGPPVSFAEKLHQLAGERPIVIFGSTAEGEEAMLLEMMRSLVDLDCFLIVAPRKETRFDQVAQIISSSSLNVARRSRLAEAGPSDVLLLDSIGELANLYRECHAAFIGGSLVPHGGQNPVEAAASGCPVAFGPYMTNFRDIASELVASGAAVVVANAAELESFFARMTSNDELRQEYGTRALDCVERNRGAAGDTARRVVGLLG